MDYRMYSDGAPAGENVVEIIKKHLEEQHQIKVDKLVLDFVGFEGAAGTKFTINKHKDKMAIPACGHFITPYDGDKYVKITSLVFDQAFTGDIYFII